MRHALLILILLSLVACNSSSPSLNNQNSDIEASRKAKTVEQFDTGKYVAKVIANLNQFDLQAFAKHLKSEEENEVLQKLKFRAGILYYLTALNSLDQLRGGQEDPLSQEGVEKRFLSYTDIKTEVENLAYHHRQSHLPDTEIKDPMDLMPFGIDYTQEAFSSKYNQNCFRFFNNFNSLISDVRMSMAQLILLKNNSSYSGVDSFRGGLMELVQKDAFSEQFSHFFKTGTLNAEDRREQNILMHKARLDALDMLIRTYLLFSVFNNESGGGLDQQSCIKDIDEKSIWQKKITELSLKIDLFYTAYFGHQSIKSRGNTLVDVADHAHDKVIWENWKIAGTEALWLVVGFSALRSLHYFNKSFKFLGNKIKGVKTPSKAKAPARPSALNDLKNSAGIVGQQFKEIEKLSDWGGFLFSAGIELGKGGILSGYKATKYYLDDIVKYAKGEKPEMGFLRFLFVAVMPASASMGLYLYADELARDEVDEDYQPMMENYKADKDYALIDDDLRLQDSGQYQSQLNPSEWLDFNIAVEEFLNSHTQSPKVYLKLMKQKYDYLDQIDFDRIKFIHEIFPNIKEDIRRHGDIDSTINYYLQLEKELSEELGIESEAS